MFRPLRRTPTFRTSTQAHALSVLVVLVLAATPGCLSDRRAAAPSWPTLEPAELGSMSNVSVTAGIWAGGMPSPDDLALAQRRGVARILSLCSEEDCVAAGIDTACATLGLEWHSLQQNVDGPISDEAVVRALNLLGDPGAPPTLIFCGDGTVTAFVLAVHRMVHQGVDPEQALMDARRSGLEAGDTESRALDLADRLGA